MSSVTSAPVSASTDRCAYVVLVMRGDAYVPGALVCAHSVRLAGTRHELVCMVTEDVSGAARAALALVFDRVLEVQRLRCAVLPLRTAKQRRMYGAWMDQACTKWACLGLAEYRRVLLLDADVVALRSLDALFEQPAPAATFSSPFAAPYINDLRYVRTAAEREERVRRGKCRGFRNPYVTLRHGDRVPASAIQEGLERAVVLIGACVLLEPNRAHLEQLKLFLGLFTDEQPFGYPGCNSSYDEQVLTVFCAQLLKLEFTHVAPAYNYIPWHRAWLPPVEDTPSAHRAIECAPKLFHFFNLKPWDMRRAQWLDLEVWWQLAAHLTTQDVLSDEQRQQLRAHFNVEDLDAAPRVGCAWCKHSALPDEDEWRGHSALLVSDARVTLCQRL